MCQMCEMYEIPAHATHFTHSTHLTHCTSHISHISHIPTSPPTPPHHHHPVRGGGGTGWGGMARRSLYNHNTHFTTTTLTSQPGIWTQCQRTLTLQPGDAPPFIRDALHITPALHPGLLTLILKQFLKTPGCKVSVAVSILQELSVLGARSHSAAVTLSSFLRILH